MHAVESLQRCFGTEVPPVLWSPPDPRRPPASSATVAAELSDDEQTALRILAAPAVALEGRATGDLEAKLCLARSGDVTARVARSAGTATVDLPHCDGSPARLAHLVAPLLGPAPAAEPAVAASFGADAGRAALTCGGDAGDIAAELRRIGTEPDAARLIGRAFATATRSTEFTLYAGRHRIDAVVAVIDGPTGRIVALTAAESGAAWTSIAEGTAHRIGRALRRACEELPGGGWTP